MGIEQDTTSPKVKFKVQGGREGERERDGEGEAKRSNKGDKCIVTGHALRRIWVGSRCPHGVPQSPRIENVSLLLLL